LSADMARAQLAERRAALAVADEAARRLPDLRRRLDRVDAEAAAIDEELAGLRRAAADAEADLVADRERRAVAAAAVEQALDGRTGPVAALLAEAQEDRLLVDAALTSAERLAAAEERLSEATDQAEAAAADQAFGSVDEARAALLSASEAERAAAKLRERERLLANARSVLAEVEEPAPDAPERHRAALARLEELRVLHRTATSTAATDADRAAALERLTRELGRALARWEPARAEHATAESLAKLVRGTGTDNQLQMRLSSYVLATRLDQVLDAANERLGDMRDQRYALRRTGEARGGVRAGLGLEVLDSWTGEPRAPSTLSGGETFVVSLALALGLADVVMHESGGLHVDTLFIDEGFGMLDPDTLDDVMDRIDALRAGGRTVGVVSHVPELRSRIPAQLHVEKGRHGSTLAVRTLVA
jgi:DNA repair protein SbcC/Rad50